MSTLDAKVPPAIWTLAGLAMQRAFPARRPPHWVRAVAFLVLVASAALGIRAVHGFHRQGTTIDPHRLNNVTSLVTDGAHSISRNPMYTALIGGLISVAMWRGRFAALLPVLGVWAALDVFQVPAEEAALVDVFGTEFVEYRSSVPRWL